METYTLTYKCGHSETMYRAAGGHYKSKVKAAKADDCTACFLQRLENERRQRSTAQSNDRLPITK